MKMIIKKDHVQIKGLNCNFNEKFKKIKGDASFREFYRKKNKNLFNYSLFKKEKLKIYCI